MNKLARLKFTKVDEYYAGDPSGLSVARFNVHGIVFILMMLVSVAFLVSVASAASSPQLVIVKKVINDDHGGAVVDDFELSVVAATSSPISATSTALIFDDETPNAPEGASTIVYTANTLTVATSTPYILSEIDHPGYDEGNWICSNGGGGAFDAGSVILGQGETVTCTIINDDIAPELTIVKKVINDDGGIKEAADFTLRLSGGVFDGSAPRSSGELITVDANTAYTLSEDQLQGYKQTDISCIDGSDNDIGHPVMLPAGGSATCTITNDDVEECTFYTINAGSGKAANFCL